MPGLFRGQPVAFFDLGVQRYEKFLTFQIFSLKFSVAFSGESATKPVPFGLGVQKYSFILITQAFFEILLKNRPSVCTRQYLLGEGGSWKLLCCICRVHLVNNKAYFTRQARIGAQPSPTEAFRAYPNYFDQAFGKWAPQNTYAFQ